MRFLHDKMADGSSPCLSVYGLISLVMANDLRVLGWITKAAQFSGQDAKLWYRLTCRDQIIVPTKAIIIVKDWIIMRKRLSSNQLDIMLTTGAKRVDYAAVLVVQDYSNELWTGKLLWTVLDGLILSQSLSVLPKPKAILSR